MVHKLQLNCPHLPYGAFLAYPVESRQLQAHPQTHPNLSTTTVTTKIENAFAKKDLVLSFTKWYTGWLIRILIMVYYNPYIIG